MFMQTCTFTRAIVQSLCDNRSSLTCSHLRWAIPWLNFNQCFVEKRLVSVWEDDTLQSCMVIEARVWTTSCCFIILNFQNLTDWKVVIENWLYTAAMKCHQCGEDKLSEEFPYYAPSENCDHALLHCLKVSIYLFSMVAWFIPIHTIAFLTQRNISGTIFVVLSSLMKELMQPSQVTYMYS